MNTSDWIATAAAFAAILGLIPQFAQMTRDKKASDKTAIASNQIIEPNNSPAPTDNKQRPKLNAFGRALVLTSFGVAFGVIELVLFSTVAALAGVEVNLSNMPTNWAVAFYALFFIPGVCFVFAFFNIASVLE